MKLSLRWLEHQPWEAVSPTQNAFKEARSAFLAWLELALQAVVKKLMADGEPDVWYTCDQSGNLWWNADHPATGRSIRHLSEAEMRVWLEQRHARTEG